jgi:flagellar basal-body rod modification protein FlgD
MAAASTGSSSASSSSSSAATISSNDFLTLLVTELQNQDPTSNADPNEYVNQLVAVNSLEQLVNINSTLSTDLGSSSSASGTSGSSSAQVKGATTLPASAITTPSGTASSTSASSVAGAGSNIFGAAAAKLAPGNLSIPDSNPSAQAVANSLSGRHIPVPH